MWSFNGPKSSLFPAIASLILLISSAQALCQVSILDSAYTFRAGTVRTANALNIISRQTGYSFTYDSRLIDPERKTEMTFRNVKLRSILSAILTNDSLAYSVIDKFIIISKEVPPPPAPDSSSVRIVQSVSGFVTDAETGAPLPFATLGLRHTGKGTVTNSNGEFGLKILPENYTDTLVVSYLGFNAREIPVKQLLGNNFRIAMNREYISIPEIIIKNQIPQEIIYKTLKAIPHNYGTSPALLTAFYREGVLRKEKLQTYSEAILDIYKSSYAGSFLNDQIRVFKSRKIENITVNDSLTVRLKAGLSTCLELDGIKNSFDFLSNESMPDYSYRITDIISYDDESAWEIEFAQKEGAEEPPMYKGSVFINTSDYAVLKADFEINGGYLRKMKDNFVTSTSRGFTTWPVSVKYSVSYRKVNDRYFLSHVRGDLIFASKEKHKLFNTQFTVFFEMAVTGMTLKDVTRFDREELAPIHSIFSKTITSYDRDFWGDQDFLKPEDNLMQAIRNMKVKLQEFSEENK
jgi:hypothetical protein